MSHRMVWWAFGLSQLRCAYMKRTTIGRSHWKPTASAAELAVIIHFSNMYLGRDRGDPEKLYRQYFKIKIIV